MVNNLESISKNKEDINKESLFNLQIMLARDGSSLRMVKDTDNERDVEDLLSNLIDFYQHTKEYTDKPGVVEVMGSYINNLSESLEKYNLKLTVDAQNIYNEIRHFYTGSIVKNLKSEPADLDEVRKNYSGIFDKLEYLRQQKSKKSDKVD